jgi:hypothetical protein
MTAVFQEGHILTEGVLPAINQPVWWSNRKCELLPGLAPCWLWLGKRGNMWSDKHSAQL